jgi:hypothetical protein
MFTAYKDFENPIGLDTEVGKSFQESKSEATKLSPEQRATSSLYHLVAATYRELSETVKELQNIKV